MGLDTKYRPVRYEDVLGQPDTIKILKNFVASGKAWEQGYLFAGPFGSGKTTLARIMARAMLCETPVEGAPCDQCHSCTSILTTGSSPDFTEVDAATNSGKESIQKIVEDLQYSSFSGKQMLYLFDEAHRLSVQALDAMLKPMEEGKLICLFATTEPEAMAETVFSRCAPAFVIQPVPPEKLAERMAWVCQQEKIEYDHAMLVTIAEIKECHVRDCLKAIEGLSMLGPINRDSVVSYLHLDQNDCFLDVLESLGKDFGKVVGSARRALKKSSASTCYEKLSELTMLAYQVALGFTKAPAYMDAERLAALGRQHGQALLGYASRFASRPGHPNDAMFLCDLGILHHTGGSLSSDAVVIMSQSPVMAPVAAAPVAAAPVAAAPAPSPGAPSTGPVPAPAVSITPPAGKVKATGGMSVEVKPYPGAVNDGRLRERVPVASADESGEMPIPDFARFLGMAVRGEKKRLAGGSA